MGQQLQHLHPRTGLKQNRQVDEQSPAPPTTVTSSGHVTSEELPQAVDRPVVDVLGNLAGIAFIQRLQTEEQDTVHLHRSSMTEY